MTRHELEALHNELNIEFAQRQRLGGYSADAPGMLILTKAALVMVRHLIDLDKDIAKLKRGVTSVRSKKKK